MPEKNQIEQLLSEIRNLISTLEKPKKDIRGWVTIVTSFLATVVIAGLSLYFSNLESQRNYQHNLKQLEIQKANLRISELNALNDLIPSIASKDSSVRNIAYKLLEAANTNETSEIDNQTSTKLNTVNDRDSNSEATLFERFYKLAKIAESPSEIPEKRKEALVKIEKVIYDENTPKNLKEQGIDIITRIAVSDSTPAEIRKTADDIISNIKNVTFQELSKTLTTEKVDRYINSIIIHHAGAPLSSKNFTRGTTILNLAKSQLYGNNWSKVSWHYAIAPDGTIWLGVPLNENAIHTQGQNHTSISILLLIDGEKELPSIEQKATLKELLLVLLSKVKLEPNNIHPHRFYNANKICPGSLVTDEYISNLIN